MAARILEGKTLAAEITAAAKAAAAQAAAKTGRAPRLAALSSTDDYASVVYLKKEIAACEKIGIKAEVFSITAQTPAAEFIRLVRGLSSSQDVDAILVPRPLPKHLSAILLWDNLNPDKDIDAASNMSLGRLFNCKSMAEVEACGGFVPCTALAAIKLAQRHNIELAGKETVVLGRSSTVGKPLAHMLSCLDATVTLCHSRTRNLEEVIRRADVVFSAIGKARFIKAGMIKPGATVIDIGTNQDENGVFCGDVDTAAVSEVAGAVSPVPGGVGPITLSLLLHNIAAAANK